jgi:hypothetical protein
MRVEVPPSETLSRKFATLQEAANTESNFVSTLLQYDTETLPG